MRKIILLSVLAIMSSLMIQSQTTNMGMSASSGKMQPELQLPYYQRPNSTVIVPPAITSEQIIRQMCPPASLPHEQKYALDSAIHESFNGQTMQWVNDNKSEYAYNASGRLVQTYLSEWDQTTGVWKPKSKESLTYDEQGNTTLHSMHVWDSQHMNWIGYWKLQQQFNTLGAMTNRTWYSWASWINDWIPELRTTYQYDWNDALILISCDLWNITSNQWNHDYREDFSYDSNDKLSQYLISGWDIAAGQWVPVRRTMYNYNNVQELTNLTHEIFSPGTAQWTGEYRHDYQWNTLGLITEDIYSEWRNTTAQWDFKTKTENLYNSTGKPVTIVCSTWKNGGQWIGNWKEEYDYTAMGSLLNYRYYEYWDATASWALACKCETMSDTYGNQLQQKWFFWDHTLNQWIGDDYSEYVYQYNYPASLTALPASFCDELDSFCHVPQTALHYGWNNTIHSWEFKDMATYFCSAVEVIGISEIPAKESAILFPNPASSYVHIEWPGTEHPIDLKLMNSSGAAVLHAEISSGSVIQVSQLPKGLYFYQAKSSTEKSNGTLLIQ